MAQAFLSLPPEVRVEIYRCLLRHDLWIWPQRNNTSEYWSRFIQPKRATVTNNFSLESAILRTCRRIYSEATSVLYGENGFRYLYGTSILNDDDDSKTKIPDVKMQYMKHLQLRVQEPQWLFEIAAESVAAAIQYFVRRNCDLRTFELVLMELRGLSMADHHQHNLLTEVPASLEVMAALVELKVSETLTVSIRYSQCGEAFDPKLHKALDDEFQDFVNRLASEKGMSATNQKSKFMLQDTAKGGDENDAEEGEDDDGKLTIYDPFSMYDLCWCLRPQCSKD